MPLILLDMNTPLFERIYLNPKNKPRRRKKQTPTQGTLTQKNAPKLSKKQSIGQQQETQAFDFLMAQGLRLLARNLSCKVGELDGIFLDFQQQNPILVIVEVRARSNSHRFGGAYTSIDRYKQKRIRLATQHFLPFLSQQYFNCKMPRCRFDAVFFDQDNATPIWVKNAFTE